MNNPNNNSDLLLEIAVFEYVAGHLEGEKKRTFEKSLAQNPQLQKAVDRERALRNELGKTGHHTAVPMSNFDNLLARIDAHEDTESEDHPNINDRHSREHSNNNVVHLPFQNRGYQIAASVAIFGVVGFMFANFFADQTAPKFDTLSNQSSLEKTEFAELANQGRMAKLVLSNGITNVQFAELLNRHELSLFDSNSGSNQVYVIAEQAIDETDVARWKADENIEQVHIFSEK